MYIRDAVRIILMIIIDIISLFHYLNTLQNLPKIFQLLRIWCKN